MNKPRFKVWQWIMQGAVVALSLVLPSCSDNEEDEAILPDVTVTALTSNVSLSSGGYGEIEFEISPAGCVPELQIAGNGANLTLVLTDASGNETGESPVNYRIVKVEKSTSTEGEAAVTGKYKATVQDYYKSTSYNDHAALVLYVDDYNGRSGKVVSNPVGIAYGMDAQLYSVEVDGSKAAREPDGVFYVKFPAGKDVRSLPVKCIAGGTKVEIVDSEGASRELQKDERLDFSAPVCLRVVAVDGVEQDFIIVGRYSDLPVVYISTPSPIQSKDAWVKDCSIVIWNAGEKNASYTTSMKGRGNSTWEMPKKPYAIKLDKKAGVLGMPKHKRWALLANWKDRTLLRNDVAFEIARHLPGLDWTPRGEFVDVVMNGQFAGNYYLCEQIKVDENRVPVTEMASTDITGDAITGGYLFELDIHYDEVNKFRTPYKDFPVNIKEPDEEVLVQAQFDYVQKYFGEMEEILYGENVARKDIFSYIDMDSFIDWWLTHELAFNTDCNWPKSAYMHKDRNGKMIAGPVWDFDWGTFRPVPPEMAVANTLYYDRLFRMAAFVARVKERWGLYKTGLQAIPDYIRMKASVIRESADANIFLWPIDASDNGDERLDFDAAVERMVKSYEQRFEQVDQAINGM